MKLVEGGQGREPEDIEQSAWVVAWCMLLGFLAIGVAIVATYCS